MVHWLNIAGVCLFTFFLFALFGEDAVLICFEWSEDGMDDVHSTVASHNHGISWL